MAIQEKEYNKPFQLKVWAKILPFLKPHRGILSLIVILSIFAACIDIIFPLFQSYAIDNFIGKDTTQGLVPFAVIYFLLIMLQVVGLIIYMTATLRVEMRVGRDLKRAQFVHLQKLSFSYYNTTAVGYILARVMSDTSRIAGMISWGLLDMMWALCYVVGVFISMFILNAKLALLIILVVPAIAILTVYFQGKLLHWNRRVRKINSQISGAYNEGITGVKTTKTMVIEEDNAKAFSSITDDMYRSSVKTAMLNAIYIPTILCFGSIATAIVLAQGGHMVMSDVMKIGELSVFISYAVGIFEPIQQLARIAADIISSQANIERISGLLEQELDIEDSEEVIRKYGDNFSPKTENWEPIKGDITFEDVTFRYPDGDETILEHFNLHIPAGTNVAIVGETGAGKSTLVNLACRFFEPTEGRVLIDGVDYRERSQLWLHSNIGYVLQNPHLFSGTVMENIRYGKLSAADEEVIAAAEAVSADTVVTKLEQGYESDVGEGGDRLSTGEKQLISFARAVLADPRIFVLDEATSSIDTQTEQLIQNAISHLLQGRTSFLIAHRLSTIRQADLILVVKDGKIIEQGTHKELMEQKGYYHNLYQKQFEEEAAMQYLK